QGDGAVGGDAELRAAAALDDAGTGELPDGVFALRGSAEAAAGEDHQRGEEAEGRGSRSVGLLGSRSKEKGPGSLPGLFVLVLSLEATRRRPCAAWSASSALRRAWRGPFQRASLAASSEQLSPPAWPSSPPASSPRPRPLRLRRPCRDPSPAWRRPCRPWPSCRC